MLVALYRMFGVKKFMKKLSHKVIRLPNTVHCSGAWPRLESKPREASQDMPHELRRFKYLASCDSGFKLGM